MSGAGVTDADTALCGPCRVGNCAGHGRSSVNGELEPCSHDHPAPRTPVPGLCAEHGGLMWSNAMRACITPDDVIRGGCRWTALGAEAIGLTKDREVADLLQPAIEVLHDIVVSEDCPKSENEWGTHHDDWYDDEGCPWCGTTEPNLAVFEC